jgi:hypothetical protein
VLCSAEKAGHAVKRWRGVRRSREYARRPSWKHPYRRLRIFLAHGCGSSRAGLFGNGRRAAIRAIPAPARQPGLWESTTASSCATSLSYAAPPVSRHGATPAGVTATSFRRTPAGSSAESAWPGISAERFAPDGGRRPTRARTRGRELGMWRGGGKSPAPDEINRDLRTGPSLRGFLGSAWGTTTRCSSSNASSVMTARRAAGTVRPVSPGDRQ